MRQQSVGEFGFEPGGFRRHHLAAIGNGHQVGHLRCVHGEGDRHFAAINSALQFCEAADATNEIDPFVAAQIGDAEYRAEQVFGEQADVETGHGVMRGYQFRADAQAIPAAGEIHADYPRCIGADLCGSRRDAEIYADTGEKICRRKAVQVADDTVVIHDPHLVGGENDGEEIFGAVLVALGNEFSRAACGGHA